MQLDQMSADQRKEVGLRQNLKFESLEYLNLSYNKFGTNLASLLFGANFGLFSSKNLESLYMVETHVDDEFVSKIIANAVPKLAIF